MFFDIFRGRRTRSAARGPAAVAVRMEGLEQRLFLSAVQNLPGFQTNVFLANDDGTYPANGPDTGTPPGTPVAQDLGFGGATLNFLGTSFSTVYVNNNGNVTLTGPLAQYTPDALTTAGHIPEIAPFFADVDTRVGNLVTFGTDTVDGHAAFGVEWPGVGYYAQHDDLTNSFEMIIINRSDTGAGNFDIEFNYDQIQWETGDASGGSGGLGGGSAAATVGYTNGSGAAGTFAELPGSHTPGALIDGGSNALVSNSINSTVPGRYIFFVRNGQVSPVVSGQNITMNTNAVYNGNVATFSDGSSPTGADDTASINWGDGTPATVGTITDVSNVPTVSGTHSYTHSGTYSVTVTVTDGSLSGVGDGTALVIDPITITTPATATSVNAGTIYNINWTGGAAGNTVQMWAYGGPNNTWTELASGIPAVQDHYAWNTTGVAHGWYSFVAWDIPSGGGAPFSAVSPNWLHIVAPTAAAPVVALTNPPLSSDTVTQGTAYTLHWTASNGANDTNALHVQLWDYSANTGQWTEMPNANFLPAAQGSYAWDTTGLAPGWHSFAIHATDGDLWSYAGSPGWLDITVPAPTVTFLTPTSGQAVGHGHNFMVQWSISGLTTAEIGVSKVQIWAVHDVNGSPVWAQIAASVSASAGTYTWTVPSSPGAGTYYAFAIWLNYGNEWWIQASPNWLKVT